MRGTLRQLILSGPPSPSDADEALSDFVEWMGEREVSHHTIRVRRDVLLRLRTFLGRPLTEAAEGDLLQWRKFACRGRRRSTEHVYVTSVRAFFAWAEATGRTPGNPAVRLRPPSRTEIARERLARRDAEMDEVEKFFQQHPEAGLGRGGDRVRLPACPTCGRVKDRALDLLLDRVVRGWPPAATWPG